MIYHNGTYVKNEIEDQEVIAALLLRPESQFPLIEEPFQLDMEMRLSDDITLRIAMPRLASISETYSSSQETYDIESDEIIECDDVFVLPPKRTYPTKAIFQGKRRAEPVFIE